MKILGIDPGTRSLGYCVLVKRDVNNFLAEAGIIRIKMGSLQQQILQMEEGIDLILKSHKIDEVAIEDIFFAHNPKTVLKLAQFRGALSLKILQKMGQFYEYSPLEVKRSVVGNGKATKEQVAFMVRKILSIKKEIKPFDITDAMAVAITHSQRINLKKL